MSDGHHGFHFDGFALVVVLFILLIIVCGADVSGSVYGGY